MIRNYKDSDMEQVMDIWFRAQTGAHPFLLSDFITKVDGMMRNVFLPNSKTWVYEKEGNVIGFVAMMGNEIGGLFVDPDSHSRGIGTQLVNHMKPMFDTLEVEVFSNNVIGRGFYKKYGFKPMKEYLHEETNEMVLRLTT